MGKPEVLSDGFTNFQNPIYNFHLIFNSQILNLEAQKELYPEIVCL